MPLCFDLDGTLGSFGGSYLLLRQVLGKLWGREPSSDDVASCHGSTDWEIVDELHQRFFHRELTPENYALYDEICFHSFQSVFHSQGRLPVIFQGIVEGMSHLVDVGHSVWLVSGNTPRVLEFKALTLGVDPRVQRLGSIPYFDRAGLIRKALEGCSGPHLYVGDRPHDCQAAKLAGVPFLGVGEAVPGDHPILSVEAEAHHLVQAVQKVIGKPPLGFHG